MTNQPRKPQPRSARRTCRKILLELLPAALVRWLQIRHHARLIRQSGLLDPACYLPSGPAPGEPKDPAIHYLTIGRFRGAAPSTRFDPAAYLEQYPDVAWAGIDPLIHYITAGRAEGRRPTSPANLQALQLPPSQDPPQQSGTLAAHPIHWIRVVHHADPDPLPALQALVDLLAPADRLTIVQNGGGDLAFCRLLPWAHRAHTIRLIAPVEPAEAANIAIERCNPTPDAPLQSDPCIGLLLADQPPENRPDASERHPVSPTLLGPQTAPTVLLLRKSHWNRANGFPPDPPDLPTAARTFAMADAHANPPAQPGPIAPAQHASARTGPALLLYTPFPLLPGGGERYLLTMAAAWRSTGPVRLVTPQPVSRTRLLHLAHQLNLPLDHVELHTEHDLATLPRAHAAVLLGNEILPALRLPADQNIYMCQFPFPSRPDQIAARWPLTTCPPTYLANSNFSKQHIQNQLHTLGIDPPAIHVLYPPVPSPTQPPPAHRPAPPQILSIGRFARGGHNKRQDVLIDAFRLLHRQHAHVTLCLVGSCASDPQSQQHLQSLHKRAEGLPIHFHTNAPAQALQTLLQTSTLYWHAAGYGVDPATEPHRCEHFGIAVVEAMAAGCIPLVFPAGGPAEIVQHGLNGLHWTTPDQLASQSASLLSQTDADALAGISALARRTAETFSEAHFSASVLNLLKA